jgi:hypothetical protein
MTLSFDVALLAPVPFEHLDSGQQAGLKKVAFGSRAFETFYELDTIRNGLAVAVYIYASHTDNPIGCQVSWRAKYIGFVRSEDVPREYEELYRPPTTRNYRDDNRTFWPIFWEVVDLQPLATPIPIHQFTGKGRKRSYQKNFVPEGPLLIEYPNLGIK